MRNSINSFHVGKIFHCLIDYIFNFSAGLLALVWVQQRCSDVVDDERYLRSTFDTRDQSKIDPRHEKSHEISKISNIIELNLNNEIRLYELSDNTHHRVS